MNTKDFDYQLPPDRIAQSPAHPRENARLMVVDRKTQRIEHKHIYDIVDYFRPDDVVVWNNSKVFKARLFGKLLSPTGQDLWEHKRDVELFLVRSKENTGVWQVLMKPGRHVRNGMRIAVADDFYCDVVIKEKDGTFLVQFPYGEERVHELSNQYGSVPLPPYIKDEKHELESYQTVYAKHEGSVAAPTAGFHFTPELIARLKEKGVTFLEVTLHVGLGTFLPVKTERIEDHTMHSEWVEMTEEVAEKINSAKKEGRRIVAIGTTTVRMLEGISCLTTDYRQQTTETVDRRPSTVVRSYRGEINIFITPGFEFRVVDAMVTNFHLPKSTLLMLVSAFVGDREFVLDCYKKAVEEEYRFFSFGDAMFIY